MSHCPAKAMQGNAQGHAMHTWSVGLSRKCCQEDSPGGQETRNQRPFREQVLLESSPRWALGTGQAFIIIVSQDPDGQRIYRRGRAPIISRAKLLVL